MTRSVWIVTVGSVHEGGDVESVHATREGGMLVIEKLLAENDEERDFARSMDPSLERLPMAQRGDDDFWTDGSEFIKLKEWVVKP